MKRGAPRYEPHLRALIEAQGVKLPKPSKYGSVESNGYDSKKEANYAAQLGMRKAAANGDVLDWIEQVPIKLSCGTYRVDFLVFFRDGTFRFVEVKGFRTQVFKMKLKALENERPALFALLEVV